MPWRKGNSEIESRFIRVPIKVSTGEEFYYAIGTYDYEENIWWDASINKILNGNDIEFWDDSEEFNQDVLWVEIMGAIRANLKYDLPSQELADTLRASYTLIRK